MNQSTSPVRDNIMEEWSIEEELQATVESLRKSRQQNCIQQQQLNNTTDKLKNKYQELERSKTCINIFNREVLCLQEELQQKSEQLNQIKDQLQSQRQSLVSFQQYFSTVKQNRWRLMTALMSTRKLIALGLERVKQPDESCSKCRMHEAASIPRAPTPIRFIDPNPKEEEDEDGEERAETPNTIDLQNRVECLERQLLQIGEERHKEHSELTEVLESLEDEVGVLREEDSRHALLEERLLDSIRLLRSLIELNFSRRTIGNLVVDAVTSSVEPGSREVSSLRFLTHLHRSIVEYERRSTEGLIRLALQAV